MKRKAPAKDDQKIVILNQFFRDGDVLFFYDKKRDVARFFGAIVEPPSTGNITLYIYPRESDRVDQARYYEKQAGFFHFPILDRRYKKLFVEDIKALEKQLSEFMKKNVLTSDSRVKIFIDFEDTLSPENIEQIASLKNKISRDYKESLINQIYAVEVGSLSKDVIKKLDRIGDKFVVTSAEGNITISSVFPSKRMERPPLEPVPYEHIEDRVKKSLEVIIYSILQNRSLCGFDVIKTIVQNFNVLLSQGTVYPILYDLSRKGYLKVEKQPDNKTRLYCVTDTGKEYFKKEIFNFMDAQERVTDFLRTQLEAVG